METGVERKWKMLQALSKTLKGKLKTHSGEKIEFGSDLERDLKIYTKLKKLADRIKAGKDSTNRIEEYHAQLIPKVKERKDEIEQHEEQQEEEEEIIIGPTPQLQGRIVNLLSIEISPEAIKQENVFETPSKIISSNDEKIMETPACFKRKLQFDDIDLSIPQKEFNFDPSPIFKGSGRSIFSLNREVKTLKRNLNQLLEEEKFDLPTPPSLSSSTLEVDDNADENIITEQKKPEDTDLNTYKIKHKTIKRSTRRVKMKTQKDIHEDDTFKEKQIHDFIANESNDDNNNDVNDVNDVNISGGYEEDEISDEETYERMDFTHLMNQEKKSGKHPLSNNFVKLKIFNKNRGKFRRR